MKIANIKNHRNIKIIVTTLIVAALLAIGWLIYAYSYNHWPFPSSKPVSTQEERVEGINYNPPTEQELESSQNAKKNTEQSENNSTATDSPNAKRKVSVGIAFADYDPDKKVVDIRAFTPDTIEGDGKCTARLTQESQTITQSSEAFIDSSSSQCNPILIPVSKFGLRGVWKLSVSYNSSKSIGISPVVDVRLDI